MLPRFFFRLSLNRLFHNVSNHKYAYSTSKYMSVSEFYRNKAVLVTGATGFLGQGLVEKLLRSCPDIGKIYIAIRPDVHGRIEQKYQQFLQNKVFKFLNASNVNFAAKIEAFNADIRKKNIGIDDVLMTKISNEVSVIFHCAADIRLGPTLRDSIEANVLGTKNVVELGKRCQKMLSFVHVSSTFSNFERNHVEEKIYPASCSPDELIRLIHQHDDLYLKSHENQIVTTGLTYTFCKKVAENVLLEQSYGEKFAVFRPCHISPAINEPYPFWMFGSAGFILFVENAYKGNLKYLQGNPTTAMEIVPVDLVVNSLITVGWYLGTGRHEAEKPLVVNVNSSTDNPVTLKNLENLLRQVIKKNGKKISFEIGSNRLKSCVKRVPHIFDAVLKDSLLSIKGQPTTNARQLRRFRKAVRLLETTLQRHPIYDFNNAKEIHSLLSEDYKKIFPFDIGGINWENYLRNWIKTLED